MHRHATVSFRLRLASAAVLLLLGGGTSDAKDEFQLKDVSPGKLRLEAGGPAMKVSFTGAGLDLLTHAELMQKAAKAGDAVSAHLGPVEGGQRSVVLSATLKAPRGAYELRVGDGRRWTGVLIALEVVEPRSKLERAALPLSKPEKEVVEQGVLAQGNWRHYGPYTVADGGTLSALLTGTGDADLYLLRGARPTYSAYDCRPYGSSSDEQCSAVGPGQVFISLHGYGPSSAYELKITFTSPPPASTPPAPAFQHLNVSSQVATSEMKVFPLPMPAGKKVVVKTAAGADVDLYLRIDIPPTTEAYEQRGYTSSGNETLTFTASQACVLHIGVHGYTAGSFNLKTSDP